MEEVICCEQLLEICFLKHSRVFRSDGHSTITKQIITGLSVEWIPLNLKITLPEYGLVRTPLLVQYHFYNKSQHLIQMDVNMDGSEAFMYAGYKQVRHVILKLLYQIDI